MYQLTGFLYCQNHSTTCAIKTKNADPFPYCEFWLVPFFSLSFFTLHCLSNSASGVVLLYARLQIDRNELNEVQSSPFEVWPAVLGTGGLPYPSNQHLSLLASLRHVRWPSSLHLNSRIHAFASISFLLTAYRTARVHLACAAQVLPPSLKLVHIFLLKPHLYLFDHYDFILQF